MYTLKDLWQSILTALMRFWDNRFVLEQDEYVAFLRLQIEREQAENKRLINVISDFAIGPKESNPADERKVYQPIVRRDWRSEARRLTEESRKQRAQMDAEKANTSVKSIEQLEDELEIG
jgi:hypothetical protein